MGMQCSSTGSSSLVLCPINTFILVLSFSACLAENPGVMKIENPIFYSQNARMGPHTIESCTR
jgi:hypothetical protein